VLAALEGNLQRSLRSCAIPNGVSRKLNWLSIPDPPLDVIETPFATHLV